MPDRREYGSLMRGGEQRERIHFLVYQLEDSAVESWELGNREKKGAYYAMTTGVEIAGTLARLGENSSVFPLYHGNLCPDNLVFIPGKDDDESKRVLLKDAWVRHVSKGSLADGPNFATEYSAPAEFDGVTSEGGRNPDSYSLGVLLYQWTTGQLPDRDQIGLGLFESFRDTLPEGVPEMLARVIWECLLPINKMRPGMAVIEQRLSRDPMIDGVFRLPFVRELDVHIEAGYRLFCMRADGFDEVEETFRSLCLEEGHNNKYELYVLSENFGLTRDRSEGDSVIPWNPDLSGPQNAEACLLNLRADGSSRPVVLIKWSVWWLGNTIQSYPYSGLLSFLRECRENPDISPVVVVVDRFFVIPEDIRSAFLDMPHPPLAPLEFVEMTRPYLGETDDEEVWERSLKVAEQIYPCSRSELQETLRLCKVSGAPPEVSARECRERQLESAFQRFPGASRFTPADQLPPPHWIALPDEIEDLVSRLVNQIQMAQTWEGLIASPKLSVSGGPGSGKLSLAKRIAAESNQPLVEIRTEQCLSANLAQSSSQLAEAFALAFTVRGGVIYLSGLDHVFNMEGTSSTYQRTKLRAQAIIREAFQSCPQYCSMILAVRKSPGASAIGGGSVKMPHAMQDDEYRERIISAAFKARGLSQLATNQDLKANLARCSPWLNGLLDGQDDQRRAEKNGMGSAAHIVQWVEEQIINAVTSDNPESMEDVTFWNR